MGRLSDFVLCSFRPSFLVL